MMEISIIAAINKHNLIGIKDKIPWHLSDDLKYFKKITSNSTIIVGRKTAETLPVLKDRNCIVLTSNEKYTKEGYYIANNIKEALDKAESYEKKVFVAGGGEIYADFLPLVDKLYITKVYCGKGRVHEHGFIYFPDINKETWKETNSQTYWADENNEYAFSFLTYERQKLENRERIWRACFNQFR